MGNRLTKYIFTLFLLLYLGLARFSPASAKQASFSFSPSTKTAAQGVSFTTDIIIDTADNEVGGAGAKITFNPQMLEVDSITNGTIFSDYPSLSYDNSQGNISISGIVSSVNNLYSGRDIFATITFRGKSPGETTVNFLYTPGSTRDSNIAVTYGSGDILGSVQSLKVTIQANGDASEPTTPTQSFPLSRPTSATLDPHGPIPSQAPITDPNRRQSTGSATFISSKKPSQFLKEAPRYILLLLILLATGIIGLLVFLLKRKKQQSKQQIPSQPQQPIPNSPSPPETI